MSQLSTYSSLFGANDLAPSGADKILGLDLGSAHLSLLRMLSNRRNSDFSCFSSFTRC